MEPDGTHVRDVGQHLWATRGGNKGCNFNDSKSKSVGCMLKLAKDLQKVIPDDWTRNAWKGDWMESSKLFLEC